MNGVGCTSRYQRFTAAVTPTITIREGQSMQGAEKKESGGRKKKKKKKDLMLVDITRLYYHHFMAPTKLIESAPLPCTESSLLLAGPPSLHFLFFVTEHFTFDTWLTHTRRRWNTLAQLHFHCGSHWQEPHNTCLLVVCYCLLVVCVCLR